MKPPRRRYSCPLIDVSPEDNGLVDIMVFTRFKGDGDTTVDHVKGAMAFNLSLVAADFCSELITIGPSGIDCACRLHFKIADRNPHSVDV